MCELSKLSIESATPSGKIATIAGIGAILCTLVLDHEISGRPIGGPAVRAFLENPREQ